ncbi:hypothetical protein AAZX31_01G118400 [Glycine max]
MLASRTLPLSTWLFHPPFTSFRRHTFLQSQISSKFTVSNKMGKVVNSNTESSLSESSSAVADCAVRKDNVMVDGPLADTPDDNEGFIMFGSIRTSLNRKNEKKHSVPWFPGCTPFVDKHSEFTSSSNHLKSTPTTTTTKFSNSMLTTSNDKSPQGSNSWKNKSASVNRTYNSASNSNFDNELPQVGNKLDASVGSPMSKPFDICFSGRRNPALIGATLPGDNEKSCIEMQEEKIKGGILRPGMVLLKNYITLDEQVEIVKVCRELGLGPGGFYQPGYANGAKLRLKMMCLGMDWNPQSYKYGKKRVIDGSKPPSIPYHFSQLVIRAIQEAHSIIKKENRVFKVEDELPSMTPDICIVNFYTNNGKLGLHQDNDESRESLRKGLPVVSFSIGDSAEFLYGDERNVEKADSVLLESGDVLIFGGESRHVFHGVSSVLPNSAPKELLRDTCLCPGRLNLTFRQY